MKQIEELQLSLHALSKDIVGNYCSGAYDRAAEYANAMAELAAVVSGMLAASHDIDKNEAKLAAGGLAREQREVAKKKLFVARQALARSQRRLEHVGAVVAKASRPMTTFDAQRFERYMSQAPDELRDILRVPESMMKDLEALGLSGVLVDLDDPKANVPRGTTLN